MPSFSYHDVELVVLDPTIVVTHNVRILASNTESREGKHFMKSFLQNSASFLKINGAFFHTFFIWFLGDLDRVF